MTEIHMFQNASNAEPVKSGETLFREGDQGDDVMYAVVEGEIDLHRNGRVVETVGPGGILGELSLIDNAPRTATAQARADARVVRVDQRHFTFLVQEHPTFALQVMTVMAERLRRTNDAAAGAIE